MTDPHKLQGQKRSLSLVSMGRSEPEDHNESSARVRWKKLSLIHSAAFRFKKGSREVDQERKSVISQVDHMGLCLAPQKRGEIDNDIPKTVESVSKKPTPPKHAPLTREMSSIQAVVKMKLLFRARRKGIDVFVRESEQPAPSKPVARTGAGISSDAVGWKVIRWLAKAKARVRRKRYESIQNEVKNMAKELRLVTEYEDEGSIAHVAYKMQGNMDTYTLDNLFQREELKKDPDLKAEIKKWWNTMLKSETDCKLVDKDEYIYLSRRLYRALTPELFIESTAREIEEALEKEWIQDSGQRKCIHIDKQHFSQALFDMADLWCENIDASEYRTFLEELYEEVLGIDYKARVDDIVAIRMRKLLKEKTKKHMERRKSRASTGKKKHTVPKPPMLSATVRRRKKEEPERSTSIVEDPSSSTKEVKGPVMEIKLVQTPEEMLYSLPRSTVPNDPKFVPISEGKRKAVEGAILTRILDDLRTGLEPAPHDGFWDVVEHGEVTLSSLLNSKYLQLRSIAHHDLMESFVLNTPRPLSAPPASVSMLHGRSSALNTPRPLSELGWSSTPRHLYSHLDSSNVDNSIEDSNVKNVPRLDLSQLVLRDSRNALLTSSRRFKKYLSNVDEYMKDIDYNSMTVSRSDTRNSLRSTSQTEKSRVIDSERAVVDIDSLMHCVTSCSNRRKWWGEDGMGIVRDLMKTPTSTYREKSPKQRRPGSAPPRRGRLSVTPSTARVIFEGNENEEERNVSYKRPMSARPTSRNSKSVKLKRPMSARPSSKTKSRASKSRNVKSSKLRRPMSARPPMRGNSNRSDSSLKDSLILTPSSPQEISKRRLLRPQSARSVLENVPSTSKRSLKRPMSARTPVSRPSSRMFSSSVGMSSTQRPATARPDFSLRCSSSFEWTKKYNTMREESSFPAKWKSKIERVVADSHQQQQGPRSGYMSCLSQQMKQFSKDMYDLRETPERLKTVCQRAAFT